MKSRELLAWALAALVCVVTPSATIAGRRVASRIYLVGLQAAGRQLVTKATLLK